MQKCDFNQYSSVNRLHICSRTPFLENTFGELLLHSVLNIEVINIEVFSKKVINYLKTFQHYKHFF